MELFEVAKDIFETTDEEISDQEAMESIADWSVSSLGRSVLREFRSSPPLLSLKWKMKNNSNWNISKNLDFIQTQ